MTRTASTSIPAASADSGVEDATIVATHMMLAAKDAGVDSCWLNRFDPDEAKKVLGLPESEEVLMFLDLGYPAADAGPLPQPLQPQAALGNRSLHVNEKRPLHGGALAAKQELGVTDMKGFTRSSQPALPLRAQLCALPHAPRRALRRMRQREPVVRDRQVQLGARRS